MTAPVEIQSDDRAERLERLADLFVEIDDRIAAEDAAAEQAAPA